MRVHRADWILPIARPPLRDGWVVVDAGRIVEVGQGPAPAPAGAAGGAPAADRSSRDLTVILPGLVNAHTHLELSWMAGLVPPGGSMPDWASRLIARRGGTGVPDDDRKRAAVTAAVGAAHASGTSLVGDISNTPLADAAIQASGLSAVIFREVIGFRASAPADVIARARASLPLTDGVRVRTALAPHAPYSVSPSLLRSIGAAGAGPLSIHLAESAEERRFLADGGGAWRTVLERVGAWEPSWAPPGLGPVAYLDRLGLVSERLLAVHGVQLEDPELDRLAQAGATVVACPRSNAWTGAGTPPLARFYAAGVRVAVGTDSLASVGTLSVFHEIAAMRRLAPGVAAAALLRSATLDGAAALGFAGALGAVAPGRQAALLAVAVPAGTPDVEEYLVSGVPAARVRWLPST